MALLYMEDAYRYIINSELLLTKKKKLLRNEFHHFRLHYNV